MKISLICFTKNGFQTEKKLARLFETAGHETASFVLGAYAREAAGLDVTARDGVFDAVSLDGWTKEQFYSADALAYIGACGIAVRAIAPYVRDKRTDPAVLAADDLGRFVIPLLSGHLGGANELAEFAAAGIGAQAVITTATDINGKFSVDIFAKRHGLFIGDMQTAKDVSADLLAGEPVGFFSDFPTAGKIPDGLHSNTICRHNIWITIAQGAGRQIPGRRMLRLIPRCVCLGVGCRRGTDRGKILAVISEAMAKNRLDPASVCAVASIDIKREEDGLIGLSYGLKVPFLTYSKEELETVPGSYSDSQFVRQTVGIGNVCERAAMAACMEVSENSRLLFCKWAKDGVTVAAAGFCPAPFLMTQEGVS